MVGLVIVSHSRALAEALLVLTRQIARPEVPIATAAGVGKDFQEFGTDAAEISEAIQSVYSEDGVLVLMDLGSALLSAEMALELLPPEIESEAEDRVRLCAGPIVEGCLAAAVQIGLDSDLERVYTEALGALQPKLEQLGAVPPAAGTPLTTGEDSQPSLPTGPIGARLDLELENEHGLHARPAARFVRLVNQFQASVRVSNLSTGKGPVAANSLNSLATLGARCGHTIRVEASGAEASQALEALRNLVHDNFGEKAPPAPAASPPAARPAPAEIVPAEMEGALRAGIPVSEGIAVGPLYHYRPALPPIPQNRVTDTRKEWLHFMNALQLTQQAIEQRRQQITRKLGEAEGAIFDAHLLILDDPELIQQVRLRIRKEHENAALAWSQSIASVAEAFRKLDDPYQQQRAADVEDIGNQLLFALAGQSAAPIELKEPVILLAQDLTPTETSQLDMGHVLGLLTLGGGPTSHSAILARSLGIPAIAGANQALDDVADDTLVGLDATAGLVWIDPAPEIRERLEQGRAKWLAGRRALLETSQTLAYTRDGRRVEVFANIGRVIDARAAVDNGAEGVGLLRTEFLFLTRQDPPTEQEQLEALLQIGEILGDRPVTVRTLDIGGDKEAPYLHLPKEANPFLGVRAIRISLNAPELFLTQLRAILQAGARHPVRIMFPMIATVEEIWKARSLLEKAHQSLQSGKLAHAWPVETGIMVEVPSAAVLSPVLAREVDFFSIGTNDLTQYTLAAERGSPELAGLADAMHPAVLQLIESVAAAAHAEGKWVGVCGELAGDPEAAAVLIGLGIDELSLNPGRIPAIKDIVRKIDSHEAEALAAEALKCQNAPQVREKTAAYLQNLTH